MGAAKADPVTAKIEAPRTSRAILVLIMIICLVSYSFQCSWMAVAKMTMNWESLRLNVSKG